MNETFSPGARLQQHLDVLCWSHKDLADHLGCLGRTVRRWVNGELALPPLVLAWVGSLADHHINNPAPAEWRLRKR